MTDLGDRKRQRPESGTSRRPTDLQSSGFLVVSLKICHRQRRDKEFSYQDDCLCRLVSAAFWMHWNFQTHDSRAMVQRMIRTSLGVNEKICL